MEHQPGSPFLIKPVSQLAACEAVIERGLQTFYEVGKALLEIRDGRLYRAAHGTFEDYCRERWNMSRRRANQLAEASLIAGSLGTTVPAPVNERQVRPLAELEPEDQRTVWEQAVAESGGEQPTAAKVQVVKVTLLGRIQERRAAREERPAEDADYTLPVAEAEQQPVMSKSELAALRSEMVRNSAANHKIFEVRRAIQCLSEPTVELELIAADLADTPGESWPDRIWGAQGNLERLHQLLAKETSNG